LEALSFCKVFAFQEFGSASVAPRFPEKRMRRSAIAAPKDPDWQRWQGELQHFAALFSLDVLNNLLGFVCI